MVYGEVFRGYMKGFGEAWFKNIFSGMCMGAADIVPGISGGTIAFIMGFYDSLMNSLKSFNAHSFQQLFKFQFKAFFQSVEWQFLSSLLIGICISFLSLASFIHFVLGHEVYRTYMYASFFGLISAAVIVCAKQIPVWTNSYRFIFVAGAAASYFLSGAVSFEVTHNAHAWIDPWAIFSGTAAVCALLLPGISGSYVLTMLGMYDVALGAFIDFTNALKHFAFDSQAFFVICNIGSGVILGALLFSRIISWLLKRFHNVTVALLTGFMAGGMRSIWPFWSYDYVVHPFKPEKGLILHAIDPIVPGYDVALISLSAMFALLGFISVLFIQAIAIKKASNHS